MPSLAAGPARYQQIRKATVWKTLWSKGSGLKLIFWWPLFWWFSKLKCKDYLLTWKQPGHGQPFFSKQTHQFANDWRLPNSIASLWSSSQSSSVSHKGMPFSWCTCTGLGSESGSPAGTNGPVSSNLCQWNFSDWDSGFVIFQDWLIVTKNSTNL